MADEDEQPDQGAACDESVCCDSCGAWREVSAGFQFDRKADFFCSMMGLECVKPQQPARDDRSLMDELRRIVPDFVALKRKPSKDELQAQLQRHCGGADHLPAEYRRKVPAGYEHLITGRPSKYVLLDAWRAFVEPGEHGKCAFDAASVYTDEEMTVRLGADLRRARAVEKRDDPARAHRKSEKRMLLPGFPGVDGSRYAVKAYPINDGRREVLLSNAFVFVSDDMQRFKVLDVQVVSDGQSDKFLCALTDLKGGRGFSTRDTSRYRGVWDFDVVHGPQELRGDREPLPAT